MRILIVEDEPVQALLLRVILVGAGHEVVGPANTTQGALEIAEHAQPNLALVDIELLEGTSGIDAVRELDRRWGIPSLFVSADVDKAHANGNVALGHVGKPYTPETLLNSVAVASRIIDGGAPPPPPIPRGLKLFSHP